MKLSEAIRIGAAKRPQAFNKMYDLNDDGQICSCVIGAALEGAGLHNPEDQLLVPTPDGVKKLIRSGISYKTEWEFLELSWFNDKNQMTREAIADMVEKEGY